jgi:hypothetical protein
MSGFDSNIAVLLLAYERPENTINQIKKLADLGCRIYLFMDGPKTDDIRKKQQYLMAEVNKILPPISDIIKVHQENENLKLSIAIPKAIDWIFSYEKSAVIFEDDINFHEDFLGFSQRMLVEYAHNDDVLLVTGNQFMNDVNMRGVSMTSYPLIWGWSTTSRKWGIMKALAEKPELKIKVLLKPDVAAYWILGWMRARDKRINSWIIGIAAQMRFTGKICIAPNVNLTSNIGDDQVAVHTTSTSPGMRMPLHPLDWDLENNSLNNFSTKAYDRYLEKNLYKIGLRHICSRFFYKISRNFGSSK